MKTGNDFLNDKTRGGLELVRLHKTDNPQVEVAFYGGLSTIGVMDFHKFWPKEYGGKENINDNMVQFECFKSVKQDKDVFCPGCLVQNHKGARPTKMYYAPVLIGGSDEPKVLEMMPSVGKALRDIIKLEFKSETALKEEFPSAIFRAKTIEEAPKYDIRLTRDTLTVDELPEIPDVQEFLTMLNIIRNYDDVLEQMELEKLWNEEIELGLGLVDEITYKPVGFNKLTETA